MINVFQPSLGEEELEVLREVFASNWIGKGKYNENFESGFANALGVAKEHICSISCCSEGLFQTIKILGLKAGDEVILPSISFVAAANAVLDAGGALRFADVDPQTLNITLAEIERLTTKKTKAVLLLHYGGHPCEMEEIIAFCKEQQITLIEDNACSPLSKYKGISTGTLADFGVWSFDAMKILVTGDGGMVYCKDPEIRKALEREIYLGLLSKSGYTSALDKKWWAFDIDRPGRRAIMNDISSAIGCVQLTKLPQFIQRRKEIHHFYHQAFQDMPEIELPAQLPSYCESSYYLYRIRLQTEQIRDELAAHLKSQGIYTTFRYYPLHLVPFYKYDPKECKNAVYASEHDLCLPLHQSLTEKDLDKIVCSLQGFFTVGVI